MYVEAVPNRNSPPAILLRESYRVGSQIKKRTLLNLSHWSPEMVEGLRALLKGGTVLPPGQQVINIIRSLPHGHVAAVLGSLQQIGLDRVLGPADHNRCRDLVIAMIVTRVIEPRSKLATAKALDPATAASSLGAVLGLGAVDEDELYAALDWLHQQQTAIETALAKRHLQNGTLVLYDVSSSYFEGHCCPLAQLGHSRDDKRGKLQIVYGVLCAANGCPVAIEVFDGNTGDPTTLAIQIDKLRNRFGLSHVVLVGDRGMITQARIDNDLKPAGLDWITALRAPQIRALAEAGAFQLSLFDQRDLASITADDYPGERLIVCRNPELAEARHRTRQELLAATERQLVAIQNAVRRDRRPLRGTAAIGVKVGAVIGKYKMAKHFAVTITDTDFMFARKQDQIDAEARFDGIYVIRTNLATDTLNDTDSVRAYKSLAEVERAFRCIKTVDLHIRPIFHWAAPRVRAHVCLCMLAYYVEWHMRQRLAPMLYDDTDKAFAETLRASVVAKAQRSPAAIAKQTHGTTPDGLPVHSFRSLLDDLATLAQNTVTTAVNPDDEFVLYTRPTVIQQKAFDLLGIKL
ncbi:MAG: IS1634 family transposase [Alphaproteobacteria bacterium]|nr:IS1634 family transposase [Alphaproteobacteria bacterium]